MPTLMPDNQYSALSNIRIKVRRLTRKLSESQLSTSDIDNYINSFILYDLPEHLRLFNLKTNLTFYTQPYVSEYSTNTTDTTSPLYNFVNQYITVMPPVYVAGCRLLFSQSRDQFFNMYPQPSSIQSIGTTGDGTTTGFSGVINISSTSTNAQPLGGLLLANNVLFNSIDANGGAIALVDYPVSSVLGALGEIGVPQTLPSPYGQINYITGQFTVNFPVAPAANATINSQTVLVQPAIPSAVLFYQGVFTFRAVPDQVYPVTIEAYKRPTQMLADDQQPELAEWWEMYAYGAAVKILQDLMDMETLTMITPEFENRMILANRRTVVQQTTNRTSTIYSTQLGSIGNGLFGGGFFNGNQF